MGDDNSLKNRVQPANSPQAKCFFSRAMMGSELVAVPDFSLLHRFLPRAAKGREPPLFARRLRLGGVTPAGRQRCCRAVAHLQAFDLVETAGDLTG